MSAEELTEEALRLPPQQRARLAESLWQSLAETLEAPNAMEDTTAIALAQERDKQIASGEVTALSHEEMTVRLRR